MDKYLEFLKRKIKVAENFGFEIDKNKLNAILKPHQKDIVTWALNGGRRAIFASFGMGKTMMQLEVGYQIAKKFNKPVLFGVPLLVRHEFYNDINKLAYEEVNNDKLQKLIESGAKPKNPEYKIKYCKTQEEVEKAISDGYLLIMANYERIRDAKYNMNTFIACCLDEASVIRSMGTLTTQYILRELGKLQFRFVFTATPSPNEYHELLKYSEFLGIMNISHALSRYFKRDSVKAHNSSLLEHREADFWLWVSTWGTFIQKPSDLGYDDTGYDFPEMEVYWHRVEVKEREQIVDDRGNIEMFNRQATSLVETSKEKRDSMFDRIGFAKDVISNTNDNWLIWHHREDERHEIQKQFGTDCKSVYGSQTDDKKEDYMVGFANGKYKYLSTKPEIAGSGCNFQYHCNKAFFVGIDYRFNDFIQAIHRIARFGQNNRVEIHIAYTDAEDQLKKKLEAKWKRHNILVTKMTEIIRKNKLTTNIITDQKRKFMLERQEYKGQNFIAINNDSCIELKHWEENTVDFICTSIPFSDLFEYADSYNDMGQSLGDEEFFQHMDFLTPELLRVLKPGRIAAIHVKDVIKYNYQNGAGFPTLHPFSDAVNSHFKKHGFWQMGRITVTTDVVRENNQTYRLGWSEKCKDGTKMGVGLPEYVLLFRKAPTSNENAYADVPVTHFKEEYKRARWQLDAHSFWKSNGNRLLTDAEISQFDLGQIMSWWQNYDLNNVYDFYNHVQLCEKLDSAGKLPVKFMSLPTQSKNPSVWDDIQRIKTLNTEQARARMIKHVCPLQLDLIERLIERYTNKDETVLDPFGGIGSTSFQAMKMQRKGITIELHDGYWKDSLKHLQSLEYKENTPTLFDLIENEQTT